MFRQGCEPLTFRWSIDILLQHTNLYVFFQKEKSSQYLLSWQRGETVEIAWCVRCPFWSRSASINGKRIKGDQEKSFLIPANTTAVQICWPSRGFRQENTSKWLLVLSLKCFILPPVPLEHFAPCLVLNFLSCIALDSQSNSQHFKFLYWRTKKNHKFTVCEDRTGSHKKYPARQSGKNTVSHLLGRTPQQASSWLGS